MFVNVFANVGFHLSLAATVEQAVSEMQRDGSGLLPVAAAVSGNGDGMSFSLEMFLLFSCPARDRADQTIAGTETVLRLLQLRYDLPMRNGDELYGIGVW